MAKDNVDKNTIVVINLDRPRFLRFGHSALKKLGALTGKSMGGMDEGNFDLGDLEKVMFCGLLWDAQQNNETLKLEDMELLLDSAENFHDIVDSMNKAFENAFKNTEKQKN